MRRSPTRRAPALALLLSTVACAPGGSVHRALDPGAVQARLEGTIVSLTAVDYGPDDVVLHLEIANRAAEGLAVSSRDMLLHLDGLDYAPRSDAGVRRMGAGATEAFIVAFETGRPLLQPARLSIQGLRRPDAYLPAVLLVVPARPATPRQSGTGP